MDVLDQLGYGLATRMRKVQVARDFAAARKLFNRYSDSELADTSVPVDQNFADAMIFAERLFEATIGDDRVEKSHPM